MRRKRLKSQLSKSPPCVEAGEMTGPSEGKRIPLSRPEMGGFLFTAPASPGGKLFIILNQWMKSKNIVFFA